MQASGSQDKARVGGTDGIAVGAAVGAVGAGEGTGVGAIVGNMVGTGVGAGVGDVEILQHDSKPIIYQEARDLCLSKKGSFRKSSQK